MNLNQVTLIGRLTRDPEQKALPNGTAVVNFSIATSRTWKDKDGEKKEETEFHNCVAFGRTAEVIGQYLKKGQLANVVGRLQTRKWEKDGHTNYRTEIIVDQMQMGPKAGNAGGGSSETKSEDTGTDDGDPGAINPDDIPF